MVTYWLFKCAQILVLLMAMMLLLLVPARHVLVPLWPWPVEEVIVADPVLGDARRQFVAAQPGVRDQNVAISRDRPVMLVVIEKAGGENIQGFLVGVRPEPDADLMEGVPSWLFDHRLSPVQPSNLVLVVMLADESRAELTLGEVHRMYRPNRLSVFERVLLTGQRVTEIWQMYGWLPGINSEPIDSERDHLVDMLGTADH